MQLINYELSIIYHQLNKSILSIKKRKKEQDPYKVYCLTKSWNTSVKDSILVSCSCLLLPTRFQNQWQHIFASTAATKY